MPKEPIEYKGVQFSPEGIANIAGTRVELFVEKKDIHKIRLRYDHVNPRRWFQIAFGAVLLVMAAWQIVDLVLWALNGGTRSTTNFLILVPMLGVGGWAIWDAVIKQWFFEVETLKHKIRPFPLDGRIQLNELRDFVSAARQMGYQVEASSLAQTQE